MTPQADDEMVGVSANSKAETQEKTDEVSDLFLGKLA